MSKQFPQRICISLGLLILGERIALYAAATEFFCVDALLNDCLRNFCRQHAAY